MRSNILKIWIYKKSRILLNFGTYWLKGIGLSVYKSTKIIIEVPGR